MKLNTNYFYLNNKKVIEESEIDAGATMFEGQWVTNYQESDTIEIKENNELSIYVPSTIDVNKINEQFELLTKNTENMLKKEFNTNVKRIDTKGAWKSEQGLVFEDINILSINANYEKFESTLEYFINLAEKFKKDLSQEGISIGINDGLMII